MLFTSYEFIIFMISVIFLYYIVPGKVQWCFLLVASSFFYGYSHPQYLFFIIITVITAYIAGLKISEFDIKNNRGRKKAWLVIFLIINIGILSLLKYTDFFIDTVNEILNKSFPMRNFILPMGISYYTFQITGYIIDVYRGKIKAEKNPFKLILFTSFFPQLIHGPISRYDELTKTLFEKKGYNHKAVSFGIQRIIWGYFKKLVIADRVSIAVINLMNLKPVGMYAVMLMVLYAIEIYCDFTGGIDIAIGIGETMGIKMPENFIRPYFSKSIGEYWRRWHITMGTWFRDYVFYPVSTSRFLVNISGKARKKLGQKAGRRTALYIPTLTVWLLTGLWHGAGWNYIVWGMLNGIIILISYELTPSFRKINKKLKTDNKPWFGAVRIIRTFLLMSSLRLLDCFKNPIIAFKTFGSIFCTWNYGEIFNGKMLNTGLTYGDAAVILIGVIILLITGILGRRINIRERLHEKPVCLRYCIYVIMIVTIVIFGVYGKGYDSSLFIYSRF